MCKIWAKDILQFKIFTKKGENEAAEYKLNIESEMKDNSPSFA